MITRSFILEFLRWKLYANKNNDNEIDGFVKTNIFWCVIVPGLNVHIVRMCFQKYCIMIFSQNTVSKRRKNCCISLSMSKNLLSYRAISFYIILRLINLCQLIDLTDFDFTQFDQYMQFNLITQLIKNQLNQR